MTDTSKVNFSISEVLSSTADDFVTLVYISGLDPKTSFRHANLRGIDFSHQDLRGFDFEGSYLDDCVFDEARIDGANFIRSTVTQAQLRLSVDWVPFISSGGLATLSPVSPAPQIPLGIDVEEAIEQALASIFDADSFVLALSRFKAMRAMGYLIGESSILRLIAAAPDFSSAWLVLRDPDLSLESVSDASLAALIRHAPTFEDADYAFRSWEHLVERPERSLRTLLRAARQFDDRCAVLDRLLENDIRPRSSDLGMIIAVAPHSGAKLELLERLRNSGFHLPLGLLNKTLVNCRDTRDAIDVIDLIEQSGYKLHESYFVRAIKSAVNMEEAQRLVAMIRSYGLSVTSSTYDALLFHVYDPQLGQQILSHMADEGVDLSERTYAHLMRIEGDWVKALAWFHRMVATGLEATAVSYKYLVELAPSWSALSDLIGQMSAGRVFVPKALCKSVLQRSYLDSSTVSAAAHQLLDCNRSLDDGRLLAYLAFVLKTRWPPEGQQGSGIHPRPHTLPLLQQPRSSRMSNLSGIREHMEVIGADGVHVGIVDRVEGGRIKLTKAEAPGGAHENHHHYVPGILVAAVEGDKVRLSADAANAELFEEEEDGKTRH